MTQRSTTMIWYRYLGELPADNGEESFQVVEPMGGRSDMVDSIAKGKLLVVAKQTEGCWPASLPDLSK